MEMSVQVVLKEHHMPRKIVVVPQDVVQVSRSFSTHVLLPEYAACVWKRCMQFCQSFWVARLGIDMQAWSALSNRLQCQYFAQCYSDFGGLPLAVDQHDVKPPVHVGAMGEAFMWLKRRGGGWWCTCALQKPGEVVEVRPDLSS